MLGSAVMALSSVAAQPALPATLQPQAQLTLSAGQIDNLGIRFITLDDQHSGSLTAARLTALAAVPDSEQRHLSLPFAGRVVQWQQTSGAALAAHSRLVTVASHELPAFVRQQQRRQQNSRLCQQRLQDMKERQRQGLTSRFELAQQQLSCDQLQDAIALAQQRLAQVPERDEQAGHYVLPMPESGWLQRIERQPGEHFAAGETLAQLAPSAALQLRLALPRTLLAGLQQQTALTATAAGQLPLTLQLSSVGQVVDAADRLEVWLRPGGSDTARLRPGQRWQVAVPQPQSGWLVPASSRIRRDGRHWGFIRTDSGVAVVELKQLRSGEQGLLLLDADLAGQQLVRSGSATLKALWLEQEGE
ncbi:HlyD family efflux transporter periplasmic adaptor subunit [Bacterioplanoides pacificum]|uniref:HlyD family efflux transporter periplasmic adaptor subunit n=1 Tax=Bacterioplanoides pacificum TaxID=1171596 RepID=A0ABV7VPW4_9GAMM